MRRSRRRQETSFGQRNPSQFRGGRSGGFEETGTGYRYQDEHRFGNPQYQEGSTRGRNWQGQEEWRDPWERSRYSEGRDYGRDYEQESRFGRGGQPQDWYQGFPRSRGFGRRDWERGEEQERGYGSQGYESRFGRGGEDYDWGGEDYEGSTEGLSGYEPGDYSYSRGSNVARFGARGRQDWRSQQQQGRQGGGYGQGWQGRFAGIGPQGYKRSDDRITEEINERLTDDPEIDPTNITVEVQSAEVTLKGTVSDREAKRRAEDIAESVSGVREVQNQLRVKREDTSETETKREKGDEKSQRSHRQQIAS